jgi:hypothetical protein
MVRSMPPSQFGFKPGVSIEDARLRLLDRLASFREKRIPVFTLFVDLKSAYDFVDRRLLVDRIREENALSE